VGKNDAFFNGCWLAIVPKPDKSGNTFCCNTGKYSPHAAKKIVANGGTTGCQRLLYIHFLKKIFDFEVQRFTTKI